MNFFGKCPSRVAGALTLSLVREFEKKRLLSDKKKIIMRSWLQLSTLYPPMKLSLIPLKSFLDIKLDCPLPLMRVQIYKSNGQESYEALLVDNGKLFDPTYEEILEMTESFNIICHPSPSPSKKQMKNSKSTCKYY